MKDHSRARSVSRRTAVILVFAIGMPMGHGVAPWAISLLSRRHGWTVGPAIWNFVGLVPVALGIAGVIWIMKTAWVRMPERVALRQPTFLLTDGPYVYSRNPMYVAELALWFGWAVFYGSVGVLIGFVILLTVLVAGVRYEEHVLDTRFGDAYRDYRSRVPRWLGIWRHPESRTSSILRSVLRVRRAAIDWNMSVETLRAKQAWSDRLIGPPRNMEITPALGDVAAEWIMPPRSAPGRVILYVHGGGWTVGLHNLERRMLARICQAAAVPALAVHYRLAPEHPFPAALEDCVAAYRWLLHRGTSPQQIVIVGISAGANLALATLMSLRDAGDHLAAAAVCISPMVDLEGTGESFKRDQDPAQTAEFARAMARHYAGKHDPRLSLLSPVRSDLHGLPPLLIQVGGDEVVLSDAVRLRDAAQSAGVEVTFVFWPGMWHGWHLFAPYLPEARQAIDGVGTFVREHLSLRRMERAISKE